MSNAPILAVLSVALLWAGSAAAVPPNDDCAAATPIAATPFTDSQGVTGATNGPEDGFGCFSSTAYLSVWYSFVPTAPSQVTATTSGSDFAAVLNVFDGTCATETQVTCERASPASETFTACVGRTYLLEARSQNPTGNTSLVFKRLVDAGRPRLGWRRRR